MELPPVPSGAIFVAEPPITGDAPYGLENVFGGVVPKAPPAGAGSVSGAVFPGIRARTCWAQTVIPGSMKLPISQAGTAKNKKR
jgi:hypothetical protein